MDADGSPQRLFHYGPGAIDLPDTQEHQFSQFQDRPEPGYRMPQGIQEDERPSPHRLRFGTLKFQPLKFQPSIGETFLSVEKNHHCIDLFFLCIADLLRLLGNRV